MLNPDQLKAKELIEAFLQDDEPAFLLTGTAGTGKTTLLREIFNTAGKKVLFTAPTNKALSILSSNISHPSRTIHAALGMTVHGRRLIKVRDSEFKKYDVIVVDEASMMNADIVDMAYEEAARCNTKLLLVGDEMQLPPVGEDFPSAFLEDNEFRLTINMRQGVGELADLCAELRDYVEKNIRPSIKPSERIHLLSRDEAYALMNEDMCRPDWRVNDSKYIGFTNRMVIANNKRIQKKRHKKTVIMKDCEYICNHAAKSNEVFIRTDEIIYISDEPTVGTYLGHEGVWVTISGEQFFNPNNPIAMRKTKDEVFATNDYDAMNKFNCVVDLREFYAVTCHKSQGSTFKRVYVDLHDLKVADYHLYKKLLYVAVSRASDEVIFIK